MRKNIDEIRDRIDEALTLQQRVKKKNQFRRNKARIERGKKIAQRKLAGTAKLKIRSNKEARRTLERKLLGGKNKADLPLAQRSEIEKKVDKKVPAIKRLAKRLFPKIRKAEIQRLRDFRASGGN